MIRNRITLVETGKAVAVLAQLALQGGGGTTPGIWISPARTGTERIDTNTNKEIKRFTGAPPRT